MFNGSKNKRRGFHAKASNLPSARGERRHIDNVFEQNMASAEVRLALETDFSWLRQGSYKGYDSRYNRELPLTLDSGVICFRRHSGQLQSFCKYGIIRQKQRRSPQ